MPFVPACVGRGSGPNVLLLKLGERFVDGLKGLCVNAAGRAAACRFAGDSGNTVSLLFDHLVLTGGAYRAACEKTNWSSP